MSINRRDSFSEKIGKYFGYFTASYSSPNLLNKENQDIENKHESHAMAHPGHPSSHHRNPNAQRAHSNMNHNKRKHRNETFATENLDKIDYIVHIPLVDSPQERQTRFLLAMDYDLPARDGLGIMDTALEHMLHYFDMRKVELIYCEMWKSVCLFIEFSDIPKCREAYNQLFQFFKTIFYVEDLNALEELWICSHCKHYNQFDEKLRGLNTINDKRKDEYIHWCNRCKNINDNTYKKIKYSYQRASKHNGVYTKSNRDQIGSISKNVAPSFYRNKSNNTPHNEDKRHRSSTDPDYKQNDNDNPQWQNAKSQPIACTSSISAQISAIDHEHEDDKNHNEDRANTVGRDILMGHADIDGHLKFNIPNNKKLHLLNPSKSMDSLQQHNKNRSIARHHYRHSSAISAISSSPEIMSPASSASMPPKIPFGLNIHNKKNSVDSAISVASTTSTVSSIDGNLDLCCTILENIEQETKGLRRNDELIYDQNVTQHNLQELELQKKEVVRKIARLKQMLMNIQNTFTTAIDLHKSSMSHSLDDCKDDHVINNVIRHQSVYKGHLMQHKETAGSGHGAPLMVPENALTSQNLYTFQQQQQPVLSASDEDKYTHSAPSLSDYNHNIDDDDLHPTAGTHILMGHAQQGPVQFKILSPHHK